MSIQIATGRYHGGLVQKSGLLPVGTTVGAAKWLSYELAANVGPLAPHGCREFDGDRRAFEKAYRARLDCFGVGKIQRLLEAVAAAYDAEGVVLLCFEDVLCTDEFCHRRMFAKWWQEKTGEVVPELAPADVVPTKLGRKLLVGQVLAGEILRVVE